MWSGVKRALARFVLTLFFATHRFKRYVCGVMARKAPQPITRPKKPTLRPFQPHLHHL
jgi:hypothetical protein